MATEKNSNGYEGLLPLCLRWLKPIFAKLSNKAVKLATMTKKLAKDDSRRVVHAFKVGLAISLVSLLYYFKALYDGFGTSTMWAIVTVIVVVEFSVGKWNIGRSFQLIFFHIYIELYNNTQQLKIMNVTMKSTNINTQKKIMNIEIYIVIKNASGIFTNRNRLILYNNFFLNFKVKIVLSSSKY